MLSNLHYKMVARLCNFFLGLMQSSAAKIRLKKTKAVIGTYYVNYSRTTYVNINEPDSRYAKGIEELLNQRGRLSLYKASITSLRAWLKASRRSRDSVGMNRSARG